jgi:hypothetical protein
MLKLLPVLLVLFSSMVFAATKVYKTVDENGVVSFSDISPEQGDVEILKINAATPQPDVDQQANLDAMRETTDKMATDRREREKHRAELKEIAAEKKAAITPQPIYTNYYPVYPGNYLNPGRPRPVHPIARPPLRPHPELYKPMNSQLMRPIVSTRR